MPSTDPTVPPVNRNISPDVEIAHVLFMDLVAFGLVQTTEAQAALVRELQQIVQSAPEVQRLRGGDDLLMRPTGDGFALVFFHDALCPIRAAIEIAREIKRHPYIRLRMGIHSGPVYRIRDINNNVDVSGDGIVNAQRVMDFGDANHILLSGQVADLLSKLEPWGRYIEDLKEWPTKNNVPIRLYSLYTREVGNRSTPSRLVARADAIRDNVRRHAHDKVAPKSELSQGVKNSLLLFSLFLLVVSSVGLAAYFMFPTTFRPAMEEAWDRLLPRSRAPSGLPKSPPAANLRDQVTTAPQLLPRTRSQSTGKPAGDRRGAAPKSPTSGPAIEPPGAGTNEQTFSDTISIPKSAVSGSVTFEYHDDAGNHATKPLSSNEDGDDVNYSVEIRHKGPLTFTIRDEKGIVWQGDPRAQEIIISGERNTPQSNDDKGDSGQENKPDE